MEKKAEKPLVWKNGFFVHIENTRARARAERAWLQQYRSEQRSPIDTPHHTTPKPPERIIFWYGSPPPSP